MQQSAKERLLKTLAKDHTCYVLITCSDPDELGKLDVELTYDGDPTLAAYLLEGAQSFIDDQFQEEPVLEMD
jgi:hypothetical protein